MTDNANAHSRSSHPVEPQPVLPNGAGNGRALASLICGICAIVFSWTVVVSGALGIVAIVLALPCAKGLCRDARAVAGKVCGIVGILCSAAMLALYVLIGAFFLEIVYDDLLDARYGSPVATAPNAGTAPDAGAAPNADATPESADPNAMPGASQSDDVVAAKEAVKGQLEKIANPDQATLDLIAREADREFADDLGFALSEVGVDPLEFAAWLVQDMEYRLGENDVHLLQNRTGEVMASATARSYDDLARSLMPGTSVYVSPERYDRGGGALDDATKTSLGQLVRSAMDGATTVATTFSVDVVKANGSWAVEYDEFDSIIDDVFDL